MKQYLAIIAMDIKLALRLRAVIFFNYLFPLIFFFTFATVLRGDVWSHDVCGDHVCDSGRAGQRIFWRRNSRHTGARTGYSAAI